MKCKICNNEENNQMYSAREMMYGFREFFDYFQCSKCECLQILETPQNISKYYPTEYYTFTDRAANVSWLKKTATKIRDNYGIFNTNKLLGSYLYKKFPNQALRSLSGVPLRKSSSILDVGCGTGVLLHSMKEIGFNNLHGIDFFLDDNYVKHEETITIEKKTIDELNGKWDLIMFHHCYEHVEDPLETLQNVHKLLDDNGTCLIRIPIVSSFAWKHYKTNWVQFDAPRHSFIHSIASMKILAEQANLDIRKVVYDSTAMQFWGSEQYIKDIPLQSDNSYLVNPGKSIFSSTEIKEYKNRTISLNNENQGDQAVFYLQKK
ncbi:MAG: class SAM-dependent methyltransferase [Mucilaginibacter sp.]|nr:class SAM-dependent methyltransferase [Mucilaginibacter sp.]